MGYRSQVAIAVSKEHHTDFIKPLKGDDLEGADIHDLDGRIVYEFEDVKWYLSFPCVERIMKSLRDLHEKKMNYEFIRIGEEAGDIEHTFSGNHENMWLGATQSLYIY